MPDENDKIWHVNMTSFDILFLIFGKCLMFMRVAAKNI